MLIISKKIPVLQLGLSISIKPALMACTESIKAINSILRGGKKNPSMLMKKILEHVVERCKALKYYTLSLIGRTDAKQGTSSPFARRGR